MREGAVWSQGAGGSSVAKGEGGVVGRGGGWGGTRG